MKKLLKVLSIWYKLFDLVATFICLSVVAFGLLCINTDYGLDIAHNVAGVWTGVVITYVGFAIAISYSKSQKTKIPLNIIGVVIWFASFACFAIGAYDFLTVDASFGNEYFWAWSVSSIVIGIELAVMAHLFLKVYGLFMWLKDVFMFLCGSVCAVFISFMLVLMSTNSYSEIEGGFAILYILLTLVVTLGVFQGRLYQITAQIYAIFLYIFIIVLSINMVGLVSVDLFAASMYVPFLFLFSFLASFLMLLKKH